MRFETRLPLSVAVGVALWGGVVLEIAWAAVAAPAPEIAGGYVPPAFSVGTAVENDGSSG